MLRWLRRLRRNPSERDVAQRMREAALHAQHGAAFYGERRFAEAAREYAAALQLVPGDLALLVNLGSALEQAGDDTAAEHAWRQAMRVDPGCVAAACNLASLLARTGRAEEAQWFADLAVHEQPDSFEARMRRGDVLLELRRPREAAEEYLRAHALAPGSARALVARGWALEIGGDAAGGLACYDAALEREPQHVQAHVSRAGALLASERFGEGWDEYEWRLRAGENAAFHARLPFPSWQGEALRGATVLFYGEQGLGDQIMYASCIPEIMAAAATCHVECEPRLTGLFRRSFPGARVHSAAEEWWHAAGNIRWKIAAASAPRYLRRDAAAFPDHRGYLRAAPDKVDRWRTLLGSLGPGPKIGVSWRGGVQGTGRSWRSLPLQDLVAGLGACRPALVSLQYGSCEPEIAALAQTHGVRVHHWPEAIDDYEETAALVSALDLVISVPTAVVHLAGALGRPIWVLAPVRPEARYGLRGPGMRWYPSAKVYRQETFGDWSVPLARASADLSAAGLA